MAAAGRARVPDFSGWIHPSLGG